MPMSHGRNAILLALPIVSLLLLTPATLRAETSKTLDLGALLRERDPESLISSLKDEALEKKAKETWAHLVMADSHTAMTRNLSVIDPKLYANPSLQAYVNRLGQSLIPKEASDNIYISFKIIEDPFPYADTLATGTVYLSTGMISLLDNESQLAFLLMHEAGHVMLSHHI